MKQGSSKTIREHIKEKSALYHAYRVLRGIYQAEVVHKIGHRAVDFSQIEWADIPLQSPYDELMGKRLKEYSERLEILIAGTQELGSVPIFVTQPSRKYRFNNGIVEGMRNEELYDGARINGVDYFHMMRKLDEVTILVCNKHNAICLDMARDTIWEDNDFYDFEHMTPRGAKKVGIYLFEKLKKIM